MNNNRIYSLERGAALPPISVRSNNAEISKSSIFRPPKTPQEKLLCYVLCLLFIITMMFLAALCIMSQRWGATLSKISYAYTREDFVCNTDECKETARNLLANIDPNADPCVDFYQYACGGWMKNNPLSNETEAIFGYTALINEIEDIVVELLENISINVTKPKAVAAMGRIYRGCMDKETRDAVGLGPLKKLLKDMGGWPMVDGDKWNGIDYSWYKHVAESNRKLMLDIIVKIGFLPKVDDTKQYIMHLKRGKYIFEKYYKEILNNSNPNESHGLIDSIADTARFLGSEMEDEKLREEARKLIIFELGLFVSGKEEEDAERTLQDSVKSLDENITDTLEKYPDFTYRELLNLHIKSDISVTDETEMYIDSYSHFLDLPTYIDKVDSRHVANYISYYIVSTFAVYTVEELWGLNFKSTTDWMGQKRCAKIVKTFMSDVLDRIYVDKYFSSLSKYHLTKMVEMIRLAYSSTLDQNLWMDKNTMLYSLVKLQSIESTIGYPEWITNDRLLDQRYEKVIDVEENDYFGAIVKLCIIKGDVKYDAWNKTVLRNDTLRTPVMTVNAYYSPGINFMTIPAGILGYPYYKFGRIDSVNYGGIGTIIGHEISHAFDAAGRKFDHEGNYRNWWTKDALRKFLDKARCFAEQYDTYLDDSDPLKVDGNKTISENIADNGAIRNAFKAFRLHLALSDEDMTNRKVLPGLSATPEQLFFLGYASVWCSSMSDEYARRFTKKARHSTHKLRVNVPLANFKEFARTFKCNPGTPMNPRHKCVLW